jgi:tetratricopeptide (TPR) repeat protein
MFAYGRVVNGVWSGSEWKESPLIRRGDRENRLAIRKTGSRLEYLINGTVVASTQSQPMLQTNIGFAVTGKRQVEIDDLVISQVFSTAEAEAKSKSRRHLEQGRDLLKAGRNAEALGELDQAIQLDPRLDAAHFLKASALMRMQKPDEAISHFDNAIGLYPTPASYAARGEAYWMKANVLARSGKQQQATEALLKAKADLTNAVAGDQRIARVWSVKAGVHFMLGEEEQGCVAAKHACKLGDCSLIEEFSECVETDQ